MVPKEGQRVEVRESDRGRNWQAPGQDHRGGKCQARRHRRGRQDQPENLDFTLQVNILRGRHS